MQITWARSCCWLSLVVVVGLLAACAGVPEMPQTSASASVPAAASTVEPSEEATAEPSEEATAEASDEATAEASDEATAESTAEAPDDADASAGGLRELELAYTPLALLQAAASTLEAAARSVASGEVEADVALRRVFGASILVATANEALEEDAAAPEVETAWEDARAAAQDLNGIVERWVGQEITPQEIVTELESLTPRIETMVQTAESNLAAAYNVDAAEFERIRDRAFGQLDQSLDSQSPLASPDN